MKDVFFLSIVALCYAIVCMETDIFVPSFPDVMRAFATTETMVELVVSLNFAGVFLSCFLMGPLADAYGRSPILKTSMTGFALCSLMCCFAKSIEALLFWRFVQGFFAGGFYVVAMTMILDRYEINYAMRICAYLNVFITMMMGSAPIIGGYLNIYFGWHSLFVFIGALSVLALVLSLFFLEESLPQDQRVPMKVKTIFQNYKMITLSKPFNLYMLLVFLPFAAIVVYVSNLSLLLVDSFSFDRESASFYQASFMVMFVIASLLSPTLIKKIGPEQTAKGGVVIFCFGVLGVFVASFFANKNTMIYLNIFAAVFCSGTALSLFFAAGALNLFPDIKGATSSMVNIYRHAIVSSMVAVSAFLFNGTWIPLSSQFLIMMLIVIWAARFIFSRQKQEAQTSVA